MKVLCAHETTEFFFVWIYSENIWIYVETQCYSVPIYKFEIFVIGLHDFVQESRTHNKKRLQQLWT
jgi:hypothetical protein